MRIIENNVKTIDKRYQPADNGDMKRIFTSPRFNEVPNLTSMHVILC